MDNKTEFFLGMADYISSASKDPRTKVGAVVTDIEDSVICQGYNGFPRKFPDDPQLWNGDKKYPFIVHAEANAVASAARRVMRGSTVYVSHLCCGHCAGLLVQAGVKKVVSGGKKFGSDPVALEHAFQILRACGVEYEVVK